MKRNKNQMKRNQKKRICNINKKVTKKLQRQINQPI